MKRITDPSFKYVPAAKQNLAATFKRIRKEMADADRKAVAAAHERIARTVTPFRGR